MLPNEVQELTEATLARFSGSGSFVEATGLRPERLGSRHAVAFVDGRRLFMMLFLAAEVHYFDKHWPHVERVIQSLQVADES